MIPYDDLVVALTTWRARQGLPVGQLSAQLTPPGPSSGSYAAAGPTSAQMAAAPAPMTAKPGSGGTRPAAPPPPRPTGNRAAAVPPPLANPETHDESLDVDDEALLEEAHYENEGSDFALGFPGAASRDTQASLEHEGESTAIGSAPLRDSYGGATMLDGTDTEDAPPPPKPRGKNNPGW